MDIAQAVNVGSYGLAAVALYTQCRMLNLDLVTMMFDTSLIQVVEIWPIIAVVNSCEDGNASGSRQ